MSLWGALVDTLQAAVGVTAQLCGGNLAAGIVGASLLLRLALLPLTYTLARRSYLRATLMRRLEPELRRIRERHREHPDRVLAEHAAVLRRHGLRMLDLRGLVGGLVQTPFLLGMYAAVRRVLPGAGGGRFLWIPSIARPDALLAALVAALTGLTMALAPHVQPQQARLLVLLPAAVTFVILLKVSAGYGLYWGASSLVGAAQNLMLRRVRVAG
jgi:YidC/Oxa1 family membrane protein insertase